MLEIEFHSDKCGCGRICQFTYLINKKKKFIYSKVGLNTKSLQFVAIPWRCLSLINEFHIFFFLNLSALVFYFQDALEPYMSLKTLEMHWGGHHRNYVEGLNKQLEKNDILYGFTMDELVKVTYNNGNPLPEFNNAAQVLSRLQLIGNCLDLNIISCQTEFLFLFWL